MIFKARAFVAKLFAEDAPKKIARRIKAVAIARSVVRANPLFGAFSYQLRINPVRLGEYHTAIVVGAGGGIGEALARGLLEKGCNVIGTYRTRRPSLPPTERLKLFRMDINDLGEVWSVYNALSMQNIRADIVVIATGVNSGLDYHAELRGESLSRQSLQAEIDDIVFSFRGNTAGPYLVVRRFAGLVRPAPFTNGFVPQICLLSSSLGTMNNELYGGVYGYRTSKGAMHALAMAMHCDLNLTGKVGMLILGPGNVATKMNMGGITTPDRAAREIILNIEASARKARFQFIGVNGKRIAW